MFALAPMLRNGSGGLIAGVGRWIVHQFGKNAGDGLSCWGNESQPSSALCHWSAALLTKHSGEPRGSRIASCGPPGKRGAISSPPTPYSTLWAPIFYHPCVIPTADTRESQVPELTLCWHSLSWSSRRAWGVHRCLVWCPLAPSLITLEKAIKPGRAEQFPFTLLNVPFVPLYAAHTYPLIPASEHLSLHLPLHLLCPEQAEDPSWPLSDFPCWLLTGTSLLSQLLHCSHCALLLLIWESGLGKGFLKPTITV